MRLFLILFLFSPLYVFSQYPFLLVYEEADFSSKIETLISLYGDNKDIPEQYHLAAYAALSHYPELKNTRIEFRKKKIKTTMACRPAVKSMFRKADKRLYIVFVNNKHGKVRKVLLNELPFDAKIGVIGHEYGHIVDYRSKNFFGICATAIGYLFYTPRQKLENKIDRITIAHSLGWQLFHFTVFVQEKSKASPEYKAYKKRVYYGKNALRRQMKRNPHIYSNKIYKLDFYK